MKTSRNLLLTTVLCMMAFPAAAQVNDTYVVPAAANVSGDFGTRWMTQVSVFNPQIDYPLVVSMTWLPTGGRPGIERLVEIPQNALFYSENILGDVFGVRDTGALLFATFAEDNPGVPNDILSRAFLVTTNTYNNSARGTFGQTIPGIWTGLLDYDSDGISAISHGILNSTRLGWRTNVGAVNLGRCEVTLRVSVYDADGKTILDAAPMFIPPLGHLQDRLPVQVDGGSVEFFVEDPCVADDELYAVVFPYTSTIDELSGDPMYQSPTLLASASIIYGKKATIDPHAVGKKIDTSYARGVRAQAMRLGKVQLERSARGWVVAN